MSRKIPPCYKCDKRSASCHSSCEDYKAYRAALGEIKDRCRAIYTKNDIVRDVEMRNRERLSKRYGRRK